MYLLDLVRYIKLHDTVRDVALWIASEEERGFMIKSRLELLNKSSESSKAISLLGSERKQIPNRLMYSKLEIILLKNCYVQGSCFLGMRELKFLPKLLALHLDYFEDFSFLGNLTTLEILSLGGWASEGLSDELGMLENLKILDLINCRFSWRFQPEVIPRLSQLEELYLPQLHMGNGDKIFTRLTRLSVEVSDLHFPPDFKFPELEKYKMCISCFSICSGNEEMFDFGHTFDVARSLKFEGFPNYLGNLESLVVSDIKDEYVECLTNKTQQKVSVSMILRNLKQVRIEHCSNLKVVFQMEEVEESEAPLLSNLKILRLQRLPDLSCIWELPTQHVRLESLVELTILHCRRLKSLFSHSLAQSLVVLEKLEIIYCPELKQIVTELEADEGEISSTINSHTSLSFPKLTTLYISTCDGLEYIFPTQHVRLESLVVLTIKKCPRLKSLFSLSLAESLIQLKGLHISYCDEMKQIVTELEGDEGEISPTINSHNSLCFPELDNVSISNCYGLEYIFPTSMSPQGLQGLTLNVEACPQLKQVFRVVKDRVGNDSMLQHQQFLRSLSSFSVKRCPLLTDLVVHLEAKKATIKGVRLSAFKESFKTSKQLELREIQDLECLVDTTKNGPTSAFTHLETLFIEDMDGLEALCKGQPPQGFLKNLKHLEIRGCCKLQVMGELLHDGEENQEQPLSNLQSLTLHQLPALRWIFKGSPHSFTLQSLKVVYIDGCGKLKSLFSPSLIQSLVLLEQLKIQHCNELETLFNDGEIESKTSSLPLHLPKLKTLFIRQVFGMPYEQNGVQHHSTLLLPSLQDLELDWLRNLTMINFPIQEANNQLELTLKETGLSAFKELLCNTKDLVLHNIGDHKNLVPDLIDLEHLDGLTSISINKWSSGECLVDASQIMMDFKCNGQPPKCFLQNLKILRVVDCKKISKIFRIDDGIEPNARYLPNLKFVEIRECRSLEYVFPHTSIGGFSHLEEVKLVGLRTLRSTVGENNFLEAPTLKILYIRGCSAFTNFIFRKEVKKCVFLKLRPVSLFFLNSFVLFFKKKLTSL
ncbi:disease resistance protein [Gossypium australe]|uniref:Disease resistance protein n=1 Tax=Gossypium australe TaxID=47621 RepID=A0A5B6VF99_9ROSI|nr:disease resistance protein [Gossypium australe]